MRILAKLTFALSSALLLASSVNVHAENFNRFGSSLNFGATSKFPTCINCVGQQPNQGGRFTNGGGSSGSNPNSHNKFQPLPDNGKKDDKNNSNCPNGQCNLNGGGSCPGGNCSGGGASSGGGCPGGSCSGGGGLGGGALGGILKKAAPMMLPLLMMLLMNKNNQQEPPPSNLVQPSPTTTPAPTIACTPTPRPTPTCDPFTPKGTPPPIPSTLPTPAIQSKNDPRSFFPGVTFR